MTPINLNNNSSFIKLYLFCLIGGSITVLGLIWVQSVVPVDKLTKDPSYIVNYPYYYGFLSNVGILFWCASASLCFFTAFVLCSLREVDELNYFIYAGSLSGILMLDDLFLLHETVIPHHFGISEYVTYFLYVLLTGLFVILFFRILKKDYWFLLVVSCLFFLFSIGSDIEFTTDKYNFSEDTKYFLEDGSKFLGITLWFAFHSLRCFLSIRGNIRKKIE